VTDKSQDSTKAAKSKGATKAAPGKQKKTRRDVLTGALIGLGASVLVQPKGGVAHAAPWKKKK
jgi:hypothetical protein